MAATKSSIYHSDTALRSFLIMILVGVVGIFLFAGQAHSIGQYIGVVGVGAMVAGAAMLGGGLLGFLFGIPHTMQQGHSNEGNPNRAEEGQNEVRAVSYQINTNLEQISDWLTKILVGVGLTQLAALPKWVNDYSALISSGLGSFASSQLFGIAELVYFLVCGFLIGYLWTRLYLAEAFRHADLSSLGILTDKVARVTSKLNEIEKQNRTDARVMNLVQRQLNPVPGTKPVNPEELVEVMKIATDTTKAQVFYLAEGVRSDTCGDRATKGKMELTIPVFRALAASDEKNDFHANHAQLGLALKDKLDPDWPGAEAELSQAITIRGKSKNNELCAYEFNRAICRINLDPGFKDGKPSDDQNRPRILEDLRTASKDPRVAGQVKAEPDITRWRKLNKVNWPIPAVTKAQ